MSRPDDFVLLAVNGTLMRGLELNHNILDAGAVFEREDTTASCYRLWSIHDRHPGMVRYTVGGAAVAVEIWSVPTVKVADLLLGEPAGLCIGKVQLADNSKVLGILAEPSLCEGCREITRWGGWRAYMAHVRDGIR